MKNLTPEMVEKAKSAASPEELLQLTKAAGMEITADEAAAYYAQLNLKPGALNDDDIANVAGGFFCSNDEDERQRENEREVIGGILCPKCSTVGNWSVYHSCKGGYVWVCNVCATRGVLEESDGYSVMHTGNIE